MRTVLERAPSQTYETAPHEDTVGHRLAELALGADTRPGTVSMIEFEEEFTSNDPDETLRTIRKVGSAVIERALKEINRQEIARQQPDFDGDVVEAPAAFNSAF